MERDLFDEATRLEWQQHKGQHGNDLVQFVDSGALRIYFTEDKYHLKARVVRGTRRKHVQEVQFMRHLTEVMRRIGLQPPNGYTSKEELATTLQGILDKYYAKPPVSALNVLSTNKSNHTDTSSRTRTRASTHRNDMLDDDDDHDGGPNTCNNRVVEYIRGDRWNEKKDVREYRVKFQDTPDLVWCQAPRNLSDHPEFAQYVYRKAEAGQPILTKQGATALRRMINNIEYVWNIQWLRDNYPELRRNSGTNILESFHSVWNSTSVSKGSIDYSRRKTQLKIRVWQRNTHYLFAILDRGKKAAKANGVELDGRHRQLEKSIADLYALYDNHYPSMNWLPINGPASNQIFLSWSEHVETAEQLADVGYKLHRSLRLGDLYGIDIVSMMYEICKYNAMQPWLYACNWWHLHIDCCQPYLQPDADRWTVLPLISFHFASSHLLSSALSCRIVIVM